jgi:hypothetical protein
LIYGKRSWIAQVAGKKYYLLNLPEEERAAEAIANLLRYGAKVEAEETGAGDTSALKPQEQKPQQKPHQQKHLKKHLHNGYFRKIYT